jgi:hypothetical protein
MENVQITKIMWGAENDLISLRHQWCLKKAAAQYEPIHSKNVVDIQLGFSTQNKRLGMASMMDNIPSSHHLVYRLPSKALPGDFYDPQSRNKRCFLFPLSQTLAKYSVDDLHRVEAILETQTPSNGSYTTAKRDTSAITAALESADSAVQWTSRMMQYFSRKYGRMKERMAVEIYRATRHIELAFPNSLSSWHLSELRTARSEVTPELVSRGVNVPDDLSFSN